MTWRARKTKRNTKLPRTKGGLGHKCFVKACNQAKVDSCQEASVNENFVFDGIVDQADNILPATLLSKTQKQNKQSTERNRAECCSNIQNIHYNKRPRSLTLKSPQVHLFSTYLLPLTSVLPRSNSMFFSIRPPSSPCLRFFSNPLLPREILETKHSAT